MSSRLNGTLVSSYMFSFAYEPLAVEGFESQLTIVEATIMQNNTTKILANDFIFQYPNPCRAQLLSLLFVCL